MIDTHCHLNIDRIYEKIELVLKEAKEANVNKIIVPGFDLESSKLALEIAKKYDNCYAAIGFHPTEIKGYDEEYAWLEMAAKEDCVVAIGECGFDFHWDTTTKEEQIEAFIKQIEIAKRVKKPLIIHAREANQITFDTLKKHDASVVGGVLHAYAGSLELAKEYKTSPILVLSSRTEEGTFNAERMRNILDDDVKRDRLTDEILNTVKSKGYDGVEADFEYLGDNYAEKYASFISELNKRLESEGYILTVDLAPKTSDNQPGSLYSGIDYEELGEAAQNSFLMTYEWGYRYSEPMAISPEDKVRDVVEYAVEKIDSEKILLGIPNYGYVWKLPYVEGESVAQSLSNTEAVQIANEFGSIIEYNEAEASPHYTFSLESNNEKADYEVWFEDARTVKGAMELIMDYGMLGMGVWNIRRYFPQLWAIVNSMYEIIKNE